MRKQPSRNASEPPRRGAIFPKSFYRFGDDHGNPEFAGEVAVDQASKIPDAAATISREIRSQYVLGYHPSVTSAEHTHRKIKVQVTNPAGPVVLRAYYKSGYVASDLPAVPAQ